MKLIIAGGRRYRLTPEDFAALDRLRVELPITEVVSGTNPFNGRRPPGEWGADEWGYIWAITHGVPVNVARDFDPWWTLHGSSAGPIRNAEMAAVADAVILFPGGKGTADMRRKAEAAGLRVIEGVAG